MKGFGFKFRRLAKWEQSGACAMRGFNERKVIPCGLPGAVLFEGVSQAPRGSGKTDRIVYCETHGSAAARIYNVRIEASDDAV